MVEIPLYDVAATVRAFRTFTKVLYDAICMKNVAATEDSANQHLMLTYSAHDLLFLVTYGLCIIGKWSVVVVFPSIVGLCSL